MQKKYLKFLSVIIVVLLNVLINYNYEIKAQDFNWLKDSFLPVSTPVVDSIAKELQSVVKNEGAILCLSVGQSDKINEELLAYCKENNCYFIACKLGTRTCNKSNCTILDKIGTFHYKVQNGEYVPYKNKPKTTLVPNPSVYQIYSAPQQAYIAPPTYPYTAQSYNYSFGNTGTCISGNCPNCN